MSKVQIITLGEKEFPLGDFTIGDIQKLAPMFPMADGDFIGNMDTPERAKVTTNIVYAGLQTGGYKAKFEDFLALSGVTKQQLGAAQRVIGSIIGAYKPLVQPGEDPAPGEAAGAESP